MTRVVEIDHFFVFVWYNNKKGMNMLNLNNYKYMIGETILFYQLIENDLKLIYAGMLKGDFDRNLIIVNNEYHGMGQIINALKKLDNSDGKPYFADNDYKLLSKLAKERNYYCHQCYVDFCYVQNFIYSKQYSESCDKLEKTNGEIQHIQGQTEDIRLKILKQFNRIK